MKVMLENQEFDTLLLPIEWRCSAAVVGLIRFFDFVEMDEGKKLYEVTEENEQLNVYKEIGGYIEGIKYNRSDLTKERYLRFCESLFGENLQHVLVENILSVEEFSEEQIAFVNNLLTGQSSNSILKKIFGKVKFDGTNKEEILKTIDDNRNELIMETYRNKMSMYRNFANTNRLFSDANPHCRLLGYDLDENRKSKSVAYRFDNDTFVAQDMCEFDFIPFAFSFSPVSFFVNNNSDIDTLCKTNNRVMEIMESEEEVQDNRIIKDGCKTKLIKGMVESYDFFDYDVEVIVKDRSKEIFETFYIRKNALKKLKQIYRNSNLRFIHQYGFNYYLNVEEELIERCVNNIWLDDLLERLLVISKEKDYASFIIGKLIDINVSWKEEKGMSEVTTRAKNEGFAIRNEIVAKKNGDNKAKSYKNKLINAIVAHDYDRVKEIMLQLSSFVGHEIWAIYAMIDNPEQCLDIAISFANAIGSVKKDD